MRLWVTGEGTLVALLHLWCYRALTHHLLAAVDEDGKGEQRGPDDDYDDRECCPPSRRNLGVHSAHGQAPTVSPRVQQQTVNISLLTMRV